LLDTYLFSALIVLNEVVATVFESGAPHSFILADFIATTGLSLVSLTKVDLVFTAFRGRLIVGKQLCYQRPTFISFNYNNSTLSLHTHNFHF